MKIAIVYDWIDKWGGAERVLLSLAELYPHADFYTSYYDPKEAPWAAQLKLKISFIQELPDFIKRNRVFSLPFYPFAFESMDFSAYDLVITITSSFAKSIITKPGTIHICYMLTPTRFLWDQPDLYSSELIRTIAKPYSNYLKAWDYISAQRPEHIISISNFDKQNIKKYYDQDSTVIYPPFDTNYWSNLPLPTSPPPAPPIAQSSPSPPHPYYLVVSRLEPYKKIDLIVRCIEYSNKKLIIVGKGSELAKLKALAVGKNIVFLSDVSDEQLADLYLNARALIMPQKEEFGYTALEAQYFGCPVISFKEGGAIETIIDEKTGMFFDAQTSESLAAALEKFETVYYTLSESAKIEGPKNVAKFDSNRFKKQFTDYIESKLPS